MPKIHLTEEQRKSNQMAQRMDKFDSVITEYLRKNGFTNGDLAYELAIDTSTLWRYRHKVESFQAAPFSTITNALQIAKCSSETLRYICGMRGAV